MGYVSPAGIGLSRRACYDHRAGSNGTLQPLPSSDEEWRKRLSPKPILPYCKRPRETPGFSIALGARLFPSAHLREGVSP